MNEGDENAEQKNEDKRGEEEGEEGLENEDDPPPPPPPEQDKELLFLIEFLVDTLIIFQENMNVDNIDPCALTGPVSVSLAFLHFPPLVMGEKDNDPDKVTGCDIVQFNSGKSLMFALTEGQFEEPPDVYLVVTATKDMPHAFRFPQLLIGKTKIDLSELFRQLFDKYDENPGKTVSKSIKDKYELMGEKDKVSGELSLYIRLTCIGENIVTEFKKPEDLTNTTLFKNEECMRIYECKETEKPDAAEGKVLPGWESGDKGPCEEPVLPPPLPDPEDENYEEIFAEINGSAITIKVEKSKRKDPPKKYHISEFCDCNIPLPQDLVAGFSDLSLSPVSEANFDQGVETTGRSLQIDKTVGMDRENKLYFKVPPADILTTPDLKPNTLTYNVKTCVSEDEHGHKKNSKFRIITDNNVEGPLPSLPNDPEKDVFVLKIIKRGKKNDGKDALELEFKTPKEKIVPPEKPPYMVEKGSGPEKSKAKDKKKKK